MLELSDLSPFNVSDIILKTIQSPQQLAVVASVSRFWKFSTDSEAVWRGVCRALWADKVFVPESLKRLVIEGNTAQKRLDLQKMSAEALYGLAREHELVVEGCCGKAQLIGLIRDKEAETRFAGQPLAKYACQQSIIDSRRKSITAEELCAPTWNVRLRKDGPLAPLAARDPWWFGKGTGTFIFHPDGLLTYSWPENWDPFANLNLDDDTGWVLDSKGCWITLLLGGRQGPMEHIARHPVNWGWVLVSAGTCWSSWPMPTLAELDPYMQDAKLIELCPAASFSPFAPP